MPSSSAKRQAQDLVLPYGKHPRIELGQQSTVDAEYRNDEASTSANKADQICRGCQKIDFEAIFSEDRRDPRLYKIWGNRRFILSHMNRQSNCTLCQFFYSTREPPLDETVVDPVYCLRVFPAKGELGAWELDFDDSPAFIVVPILDNYPFRFQDTHGIIMELSETPENFCGRQIQPQVDLSVIKGWLEICDNNHKALCKQKPNPQVPKGFRVIDCVTRKIVPWENVANPKQYVTLSYVWGSFKGKFVTRGGAIPSPLPGTIEDTILLTTNLGYRYLWIDRYCITQDDAMDMHIQIQSMDEIYQQSVVTVVAAAGDDPRYGLPGIGATPRERQPCVKVGNKTLVYTPYVRKEILNSNWNSRGWTYQEGLLARRKLVFTATQVYFQCNAMHCLESIRAPLKNLHTYKNVRMRDMVDISRVFPLRGLGKSPNDLDKRLNEYLQRSLRYERDMLNAFRVF
ncbi:HET-domain-containing protein [Zopfia rhizophila CBS 207.26]|uniref:HET-domain-containing protein n=1 Tax=Zopfia rhizophila CBS 207.26 TaxID=1314779 RepID=A0A6A6E0U9_9PEZI|nr:HET-domain-containing protein [Zopfia rhizophila CBS 207.26]